MIAHAYVEQPETSSIAELCAHVEVSTIMSGVTLREPCLRPRAEHQRAG